MRQGSPAPVGMRLGEPRFVQSHREDPVPPRRDDALDDAVIGDLLGDSDQSLRNGVCAALEPEPPTLGYDRAKRIRRRKRRIEPTVRHQRLPEEFLHKSAKLARVEGLGKNRLPCGSETPFGARIHATACQKDHAARLFGCEMLDLGVQIGS